MNHRDNDRRLLRDLRTLARLQPDDEASARAIDRARAAIASTTPQSSLRRRNIVSPRNLGAVAAALVAMALLTHWLAPPESRDGFAFAEVQGQVEKAKTVQYVQTREVRVKGNKVPVETQTRAIMVLGSHRKREEVKIVTAGDPTPDEYVYIQNMETGKTITLYPGKKAFQIDEVIFGIDLDSGDVKIQRIKAAPEVDFYRRVREFPADKAQKLPDRTIDGKAAAGFRVVVKTERPAGTDTWTATYWVDPTTRLPVRIEYSNRSTNPAMADSGSVLGNFVFDAPLDESLFSTDPPEGYKDLAPNAQ